MKLKKVTALLLATSMVVSSVSVASFADELVFEEEAVAVDNAGEEASFDDVVFEDKAEDDADYSEEVFEDEIVEDDAAVDEAFYTEEVVEDQPAEEPVEQNADVYAALAAADGVVTEDVVDGQTVTEDVVDGQTATAETDFAKSAVTATLVNTTFTSGGTAETPKFNYVGAPSTADWYNGGTSWTGASFVGKKDSKRYTGVNPVTLPADTYTVTFETSAFTYDTALYTLTVPSSTITVKNAELKVEFSSAQISTAENPSVYYGADVKKTTFSADLLNIDDSYTVTGTPVWEYTYAKGDKVGYYDVTYVKGLTAKKTEGSTTTTYDVVPATTCKAQFYVGPAKVTVVPQTVSVEYGATPVEPKYTLKDTDSTNDSGAAEVLKSGIADGTVTLSINVVDADGNKETKFEPGTYNYKAELSGASKDNFTVSTESSGTYTVKAPAVTVKDYEGAYDGFSHGLIVTPETLPSTVQIKYHEKDDNYTAATTTAITKVDPGKTTVYYYIENKDTTATSETWILKETGYGTITIVDGSEAYKAVEEMIDKLPAADKATAADKAAADAAKAAYDALTAEQQAKIPAAKVQKLNDVKAAADKAAEDAEAAKAVEEQIDALPAAAEATADTKPAADAAKAAYDALTDDQKALVPADKVQKLNDVKAAADKAAEEKDKEAEKEKEAFDQEVVEVKAAKNGTEGKAAAARAKEAYENLSPEAKAKLTEEEIAAYEATQDAYTEGKVFENADFNGRYRVLSGGEVTYVAPLNKNADFFVVHNSVENNGFHYDVVKVSNKAFFNCANAKKIKVGKNVKNIGAYAFKKTSAMTRLIVNTSNLQSGKVTNAFVAGGKGKSGVQLKVQVPSGKSTAYENLFKGEGGMKSGAKFTEKD